MNEFTLDWHSYRFLPYERRLALRELKSLTGNEPTLTESNVIVSGQPTNQPVLQRLTYFRRVRFNGSGVLVPLQARLEATGSSKVKLSHQDLCNGPGLRRQSTRYSAHGLHEYKGKFNPQIVRATANLLGMGLGKKALLLDPFCGSGTCLLEAAHMGWDAVGVDANPLAVFISNAKIQALKVPARMLEASGRRLIERLKRYARHLDFEREFDKKTVHRLGGGARTALPAETYLQKWFTNSVLVQLRMIAAEIGRIDNIPIRNIATVILSDILRDVSLQDPADLRIRRRTDPRQNYPALLMFINLLEQRTQTILSAREVLGQIRGQQKATLGDSRVRIPGILQRSDVLFDGVITSPPYATALPYIDTQRLSLALLGLLEPQQLHAVESELIGNREISKSERNHEEQEVLATAEHLPQEVATLCRRVRELSMQDGNGFRRRNMAALLQRYFRDMRDVFRTVASRVRPNAGFAMVVGPNRTTLSGEKILIDTPRLLALVAETVGWRIDEIIPLDAYQRFDLHRENSITAESLVVLKRHFS